VSVSALWPNRPKAVTRLYMDAREERT
jgi:hypothetical protein